jgi:hypothetical protein
LRLVSTSWALALLLITTGAPALAAELTFDIKIERGRVPDTMQLIRVNEGDVVKLRWTTDQPIVLHFVVAYLAVSVVMSAAAGRRSPRDMAQSSPPGHRSCSGTAALRDGLSGSGSTVSSLACS